MSAHVLLNEFNKFTCTGARMLDSIYHRTLKLLKTKVFAPKRYLLRNVTMDVITLRTNLQTISGVSIYCTAFFHSQTQLPTSKAVLLLWILYVFVLSYVCYVFVRVCLYVLCGHLLGKG